MTPLLIKLAIYAIILLVIVVWGWLSTRRAAKRIHKTINESFQANHVFKAVDLSGFPWLTRAFYDEPVTELGPHGFRHLADIEDETLTQVHPDKRTCVRICVNEDGSIRAATYEIAVGGPQGAVRQRTQTHELITELADGTTITTTNAPQNRLFNPPEGVIRQHVPVGTSPSQMLPGHQRTLEQILQNRPAVAIEPVTTFEQATAAWQKGTDRQRNRLQSQGGVGRDEFMRMGAKTPEVAARVYDEMQKIKN